MKFYFNLLNFLRRTDHLLSVYLNGVAGGAAEAEIVNSSPLNWVTNYLINEF